MADKDFVIENGVLTEYKGPGGDVVIPDSVTEIGHNAFWGCTSLTGITIPDSVTKIGGWAFYGCKSLTSITIPDSVTEIGDDAFDGCESLTSITIPDSVTEIGSGAFDGCKSLTSITIPDGVTEIGRSAFYGCERLISINIPDSVTEIGWGAFNGCTNLTSITIPDSVTEIGDHAFNGCKCLTSITIPDSVTKIGKSAFVKTGIEYFTVGKNNPSFCNDFSGVLFNKDKTVLVQFPYNPMVTSYKIPDSVTKVLNDAFEGVSLESLTISKGIPSIRFPVDTWLLSRGVKKLYIYDTNSTTLIGSYMDMVRNQQKEFISLSAETGEVKFHIPFFTDLTCSYNRSENYLRCFEGKKQFDFARFDSIFSIWTDLNVKQRIALYRLKYPYGLTDENKEMYQKYISRQAKALVSDAIDRGDMEQLVSLESLGIIKKANIEAFIEYATNQKKTDMVAYLLEYKQSHFKPSKTVNREYSLSAKVPRPVAPWSMARGQDSLVGRYKGTDTDVVFPAEIKGKKVTGIANLSASIPEQYKNIVSVVIPEGYTTIGDNAFRGCENLERITLPSTLKTIGDRAFMNCKKLKEVILPDSVRSIDSACFRGCESLRNVHFSTGLFCLPSYAFSECKSLKNVDIPTDIYQIEENCFLNTELQTVDIHNQHACVREHNLCWNTLVRAYPETRFRDRHISYVMRMTIASWPSDTMLTITCKNADGVETSCGVFAKECEGTLTNFTEGELTELLRPIQTGEALMKLLKKLYGRAVFASETVQADSESIRACKSLSFVSVKEEKHNADGDSTAEFTLNYAEDKGMLQREGLFKKEIERIGYNKGYRYERMPEKTTALKTNPDFVFSPVLDLEYDRKIFVFTNVEKEVVQTLTEEITARGGVVNPSVDNKTNYLVVNEEYGRLPGKYTKAQELISRGKDIKIISLRRLKQLLF